MGQITVALGAEELADLEQNLKPGVGLEETITGRLRGMAKERSRKKLAPVKVVIEGGRASGTYEELPDAVYHLDHAAGTLMNALKTVSLETPLRFSIDGAVVPIAIARLVVDDGVAMVELTMPSQPDSAAVEGAEAPQPAPQGRGPVRRRVEPENDAGWTPGPALVA